MAKVLTEKGIKRIRPKPGKRLHQFDAVAPGLCVRTASSGVKTYTVVARDPNGKQVWREVARVGVISLADAREKAREGVGGPVDPRQWAESTLFNYYGVGKRPRLIARDPDGIAATAQNKRLRKDGAE